MKNRLNFFNGLSNPTLLLIIFILFFIKIFYFILIKNDYIAINFSGGNDSEYYHAYALGYYNSATSSWPILLKDLNNLGLYSREVVSYLLLILNLIIIPILLIKVSEIKFVGSQKNSFYMVLLCLIYPTLYFYTFDIFRDVFMVSIFLVGCFIVKKTINSSSFPIFSFFFFLSVLMGLYLLSLRIYLGYAFLLSLFLWKIKFTKKRLIFLTILYFFFLFFANYFGFFEHLTEYRTGFEEGEAGSTLGLDFSNPVMFIPNFILSTLGQLFGLYIINPLAILLFLIETIPFVFMFLYIIKNIRLADGFVRFLIIFFVIYASIWLIGNDNLGTAVRLRMYNYFAVYICFFYILRLKTHLRLH